MNLVAPRSTPRSPGSPGRRSTPRQHVLFVITYKYRGQSVQMHKAAQIRPNSQEKLL